MAYAPTGLRELRQKATTAARLKLKEGGDYQSVYDATLAAAPAIKDHYGELLDLKVHGIIVFAANQIKVEIPS